MKKSKTQSFVLTLKLNTSSHDDQILSRRFYYAFLMKNRLIRHAKKQLSSMKQDKEYRMLMNEYHTLNNSTDPASKHRRVNLGKELSRVRMAYGLSEYQFHSWVKVQQHRYTKHIDSMTAQKLASSVWKSVETCLYRKGQRIHFQRLEGLMSLEGKNNASGMRFKDGRLYWNNLVLQPQIRKGDVYAREALKHKVKYCRIKRMAMGTAYHYYLELVLEGTPPQKYTTRSGRVGIDQGTSSEAVFSESGCILTELAPERQNIERQATMLSRKLDRSRRATNPEHFNEDGTVKKTNVKWVKSKTYKNAHMRLKTIRRRNAATVKQAEEILANTVLKDHGTDIVAEKMDFKALQLKAKEDKISPKTGRHQHRRRFGKSLSMHAPGRFLDILERKLSYIGKTINYVDTWKFRASQYDHVVGEYKKPSLSKRSKTVGGNRVQRDLYSAFLLWAALDDTTIDRNLCSETFPLFLKYQNTCIKALKKNGKNLSSFGIKDFVA